MKTKIKFILSILFIFICFTMPVRADSVIGVWTKSTGRDPGNIILFYQEGNRIKAIGYSNSENRSVWWAKGEIKGDKIYCDYKYSTDAIPAGWEPEGKMELTLSGDGNNMTGTATSVHDKWSGPIKFKRVLIRIEEK
jgi:hypothetical protein